MPEKVEPPVESGRRRRRTSVAPREVVLGLDRIERRLSIAGAGLALLLALVTLAQWIRNIPNTTTQSPTHAHSCANGFHYVTSSKLCEMTSHASRGEWEIRFSFIFVIALCILYFALRRKRAGVVCFSVFLGLGLGVGTGLVFLFLGVWLIIRAYRLQKYGEASFSSSTRVAKERGRSRRADLSTSKSPSTRAKSVSPSSGTTRTVAPEPSKRYTPKKPRRRR